MATLDLEISDIDSEYSDGFELEDVTESQNSSEDESRKAVVAQLQKSLVEDNPALPTKHRTSSSLSNGRSHSSTVRPKQTDKSKETSTLSKTVRTPMKLSREDSTVAFGATTGTARGTMVSNKTSKKFNSSVDVRDACYSDWLSRKRSSISLDQSVKARTVKEEKERKQQKEKQKEERAGKALDKWNTSKVDELKKKHKQKKEIVEKQKTEEEEKKDKMKSSQVASEKWREEKTRDLLHKHKVMKKKQEEEKRQKKEEETEKIEEATQAYAAWKNRKDDLSKVEMKKKSKQKRKLQESGKQQTVERIQDSKKAFECWKSAKDEKIKTDNTLYTYKNQSKIHTQAWRPARGMRYDYPEDPAAKKSSKKPNRSLSRTSSVHSYNSTSFESSGSESSSIDRSFDANETTGSERLVPMMVTGKRKTIQVCCQTLEYWCTCDDHS